MRRLTMLLLLMTLGGCFSDQKQELARCQLEANKIYPNFFDMPPGQPIDQIRLCMQAAGYEWVGLGGDERCDFYRIMMALPASDTDAYCFRASNSVLRWVYEIEKPRPKSN
jgi:hypothetical protein